MQTWSHPTAIDGASARRGIAYALGVQPLTLEAFDAASPRFDAAVQASADIDVFCSSSDWILPAQRALMPGRAPWLRQGEHGWAALALADDGRWRALQPLEAAWHLACPLVGADTPARAEALAAELVAALFTDRRWNLLLLGGVAPRTPLFEALCARLERRCRLGIGPVTRRFAADLDGGVDAFLARRTANFRHALRKSLRRAEAMGITWESWRGDVTGPAATLEADSLAAYDRVLAIESRSWKGIEGVGISITDMREFYRAMIPRLARRGGLRLRFGRHEGRDVAYILGGVIGRLYRGLQFSFDQDYAAISLGNVAQHHQIVELVAEGVTRYDLGSEVEYKRRWAEPGLETVVLVAVRQR